MKNKNEQNLSNKSKGSKAALKVLDSLLTDPGQKKITASQLMIILDALAGSSNPALITRFPAVLAICVRSGIELNSQTLFSKYWETSPKKQNLEKLLLISAELFRFEGIEAPKNLQKIANSLRAKYEDLYSAGTLPLNGGIKIRIKNIQKTLRNYLSGMKITKPALEQASQIRSGQLHNYLARLFSPKQKDLVFKKLNREPFTKTEREYYSRIVRKKLEAIANGEVSAIAVRLIKK